MLHIRKLALANFATHEKTEVDLPSHGLVAVTGGNGAGKSSMLESVATALWGESLRGEMGWREGQSSVVTATTDRLKATRRKGKSSAKLEWSELATDTPIYETTSKAQAALEVLIGPYDVWRRTCVLSSADSAAFALARDADRKRLLEDFLGLSLFDAALDACRQDRRDVQSAAQKAEAECEKIALQLSFAQTQLAQAKKELTGLEPDVGNVATLCIEVDRITSLVATAQRDQREATKRVAELQAAQAKATATLNAEKSRLSRLSKDVCITCGQNVVDMRERLARDVERLEQEALRELAVIECKLVAARDEERDLLDEVTGLQQKLGNLRTDLRLAEQAAKQRAGLAQKALDAQNAVASWESKVATSKKVAETTASQLAHLEAVEQVLGLRGVRAHVLDRSLTALEQQSNAWLSRMPTEQGALEISLAGSTTQKSGSVVDAISLRVCGRPYASCSGGERRRVDVALLLALRDLAIGSHGRDGTLFCDEVFDALDQQGQADVASILSELAQDRAVVVITHSPELVTALKPDLHWHVSLHDGSARVEKH